jgi:hydrogenase maturation protein HypF
VVARLPAGPPILAVGADLKNTITLVVDGQAIMSQHIGDLDYHEARTAFHQTVDDLMAMYGVRRVEACVAHDAHPEYVTTLDACDRPSRARRPVQHHRAHIASVIAEREAWSRRVIGLAFDGSGYGDDGTIWGGEFFAGSVEEGFARVAHLRTAPLAGGDAAARHPARSAAGFLAEGATAPDLSSTLYGFGPDYDDARRLIEAALRITPTTSMGRLFDAAAALVGFTRRITFEGQAAMWLEHLARRVPAQPPYPMPIVDDELDYRPLLAAIVQDRLAGRDRSEMARAFHSAIARAATTQAARLCEIHDTNVIVCSGGVFQNDLLLGELSERCTAAGLEIWTNHAVPPNDGGISLGQAAIASFAT